MHIWTSSTSPDELKHHLEEYKARLGDDVSENLNHSIPAENEASTYFCPAASYSPFGCRH